MVVSGYVVVGVSCNGFLVLFLLDAVEINCCLFD